MRLGWSIHLPGPFYVSGTIWRSHHQHGYQRKYPILPCGHAHRSQRTYDECLRRSNAPG